MSNNNYKYFKRGNWGYNPYKKYKSSSFKRIKGNAKASRQTKESMTVTIKLNHSFVAGYDSTNDYGTAVIPIYEIIKKSPQFSSFAQLYDQVKINGIKTKLNVVDATINATQITAIKTLNIVTAWDRTGISKDQVVFFSDTATPPTEIARSKWDATAAKQFVYKIGKGIVNATGVNKSILNTFQRWSSNPFLYPSTIEEKGCYLSTGNFEDFVQSVNTNNHFSLLTDRYDELTPLQLFNEANPCIPFESPSCKWKPTLYVGVFQSTVDNTTGAITQFGNAPNVLFNGEFTIDVTFRNIKAAT